MSNDTLRLQGVRAHLRVVNKRDEVLVDADVNRVVVDAYVRWETWERGAKDQADRHEVHMTDLKEVVMTPCSDRLKRADRDQT